MHALKALWPGNTIKRWLGSNPSEAKPAPTPSPAPAGAPARPQAPVARVQSQPAAPTPARKPAPATADDKLLRLPLKPIFDRLSPTLQSLANGAQVSDSHEIALQVDNILTQLPGGVVRISFGELRHASPRGIFADQNSHDYTLIAVPLSEILDRINPALLSPRNNRKRIDVPEEVSGVFGKNGGGTAMVAPVEAFQPVKRETHPAAHASTPGTPKVASPAIPTPPPRVRVAAPPAPPGGDIIQFTRAATPVAPESSAIPMPPKVHSKPAAPVAPIVEQTAPIAMTAATTPAAAPVVPAKPEPQVEPLLIPLASLTENWPAAIKSEVQQARPAAVAIAIPLSRLEGPMKTGKLNFRWSELRQWIKPTPLLGTSSHGDTEIQLALNVIAPIFFAHPTRSNGTKKKAEIAQDIPDVFGSTSAANAIRELAATPLVKTTGPGSPVAPTAPTPPLPVAPAVAAQGGAATNLQLRMAQPLSNGNGTAAAARVPELTENTVLFSKKPSDATSGMPATAVNGNGAHAEAPSKPTPKLDYTPEQVVKISCATPGVAGAMIAAEDGLMVATQLPAQFKSESLSAFVPQIFGRAKQSAAELGLPPLSSVRLGFGDQQCEIFKTGKLYYVIIGKPGEELPTPFLRKIAAELTKRN